MRTEKELYNVYLSSILTSALIIAQMDQLEHTKVYRQDVKAAAKTFIRKLREHSDIPLGQIWGDDDIAMYTVMDYQQKLLDKMAELKPEEYGILLAMLEKYQETPSKVLKRLEIRVVDSSNLPVEA